MRVTSCSNNLSIDAVAVGVVDAGFELGEDVLRVANFAGVQRVDSLYTTAGYGLSKEHITVVVTPHLVPNDVEDFLGIKLDLSRALLVGRFGT